MLFILSLLVAAEPGATIAVLPLDGDAPLVAREQLADELRAALAPYGAVIGTADTVARLGSARSLGLSCASSSAACVVQLGGLAGADLVVSGTAVAASPASGANGAADRPGSDTQAKSTAPLLVTARLFDVAGVRAIRSARVVQDEHEKPMKLLAVRLVAPHRERARIAVSSSPSGAGVIVDGVIRGDTPRVVEVEPGARSVSVTRIGYDTQTHAFDVRFDEDAKLEVTLVRSAGDAAATGPLPIKLAEPAPALPASGDEKRVLRVALLKIDAVGFPDRVPLVVADALLVEVRKLEGASAMGLDEIRALMSFEADRQLAGCDEGSCMSEVLEALGADILIVAAVARLGDDTVSFAIKRVDQRNAQSASVQKTLVDAGGEELIASVGAVIEELFPDRPLRRGMKRGADPRLALRINPPPLEPWAFWSTAAATTAALVGTAAVGAVNVVAANKYAGETRPTFGKDVVANQAFVLTTGVLFYGGVAATATGAAACGVEALFTDWYGYTTAAAE